MLSIEQAIQHCKDKAKELREEAEAWSDYKLVSEKARNSMSDCLECANEHEQLAEWLTELKELRETMEMVKKHYILVEKSPRDNPNDFMVGRAGQI